MALLKTGVIATSFKENERRVPIHPQHLARIPQHLRQGLVFEKGYGARFGVGDSIVSQFVSELATREEILRNCDLVILPKPVSEDLRAMKRGAVLWGWVHSVQQADMAQAAIDRCLTLIAFEAMYHWTSSGHRDVHIFCKNNELAGYCGVFHALQFMGQDGHYGPARRVVILSFGSVSRGAAYALSGRGFNDITIYTQRPPYLVQNQLFGYKFGRMHREHAGKPRMVAERPDGRTCSLLDVLVDADVIVNGILQDTDAPVMYIDQEEVSRLKRGCLIIDISCDRGMGFPFAAPTTFESPTFQVDHLTYYAVDHTPSYLWDSASWNISEALLPYLDAVISGSEQWTAEPCIDQAIEIRDGVVRNRKILMFQNRSETYPHTVRS